MTERNSGSNKENIFADTIEQRYKILNNNENFKTKFRDEEFKILLNPKDGDSAALITVNKGILTVDNIDNSFKKNLKKEVVEWDGYMETTVELFRAIGRGELSRTEITKKVVSRKIKVKNVDMLAKFGELSLLLRK